MELWNEICFLINEHLKRNSSERDFQVEAENLFEKLGWSRFKGEIVSQEVIPIGSAQSLKPDIIIRNTATDDNWLVVELKKPSAGLSDRNAQQLVSYMLQLRLGFGLLIGDSIHFYYDDPNDKEKPVAILEVPFASDNKQGAELIGHLTKQNFNDDDFKAYCELLLESKKERKHIEALIALLLSQTGTDLIIKAIKPALTEQFTASVIAAALDDLNIRVTKKSVFSQTEPQVTIGTESELINSDQGDGFPRYSGTPVIWDGQKLDVSKRDGETFQEFVKRTLRFMFKHNMIPQEELRLLQTRDYSKRTFGIDHSLLETQERNTRDGGRPEGQSRYWTREKFDNGEYFACSQWWKQHMGIYEPRFAFWIERIVKINELKDKGGNDGR